jgi:flagellin
VRDILAEALGSDWSVTASGAGLNVRHNFVGDFQNDAFTMEITGPGSATDIGTPSTPDIVGSIFANIAFNDPDDPVDVADLGVGTVGRDVTVQLNGNTGDVAFDVGNTNLMFGSTAADTASTGAAPAGNEITLRGRDSIATLFASDETAATDGAEVAFSFQISDASRLSGAIVSVNRGSELALQIGANTGFDQTMRLSIGSLTATSMGIGELSVLSHVDAQNAMSAISLAIQQVSDTRAMLGATQNRLEHTILNLDTVAENLQDAESRIRDVDMAREMMNFTRFNILTQASQAMMAQANNLPQGVLQLLR